MATSDASADPFTAFADAEALTQTLRLRIIDALGATLCETGRAGLAVSGGSTPKPIYEALSETEFDWSRVTVVLIDERWVAPDQDGSNERFVRSTLLRGQAQAANFIGLKTDHENPANALEAVNQRLAAAPWPFAAIVLGLGSDGHTASWFPRAEGLHAALDPTPGLRAVCVRAERSEVTGVHVDRITLTRGALTGARLTALAIRGDDKREAFERVRQPGLIEDAPARALWTAPGFAVETFWAP